ncbi:MAG: beta strand repeat-containing protein [Solirubrobacterales bacterium]
MKRPRKTGVAGCLLAGVAVALAGSALAYFSANGTGSASAAVMKLTAPTITAATPAAGGAVTLTWSAMTPPGEGTVSYYVKRDGGAPAGNCPSQSSPSGVTTCIDGAVPIGEHTYEVIALWRTWEATSSGKTAKITTGVTTAFTVSASATAITAGGTSNLTITAKDEKGNTVTTYTGSHSLVFSGAEAAPGGTKPTVSNSSGTATNFGTATAISFTNGVATVNSTKNGVLRLYGAGTANIVATEGSITTPSPAAITVAAAAASKFALTAASATPAVGAVDALTTTAQDTYGNTATSYAGAHSLVFSGASASPSGTLPTVSDSSGADIAFGTATTVNFTAGVAKASEGAGGNMKLYKTGSTAVKATEGSLLTPTAVTVTVAAGTATKLVLTSATATPVAATGFNLTTTAQDVYGNTATGYTGAKSITFAGATASPSGALPTVVNSAGTAVNFGTATALSFTSGVATPASSKNGFTKLNKVETASITASDGTISTAASLPLTVSAGAANRLAFSGLTTSAGVIGSPCFFTCAVTTLGNSGTIKAKLAVTDSVGNQISNSARTITVTATAGSTVTGSPLTTPESGPAVTGTEFTYTAPASGSFTHTITAASTGLTSATATASK